jgi:hypothetical protein
MPAGGTLGPFAAAVDCLNWPLTDLLPQCDHDVQKPIKKHKNLCPQRGQFEWHICRPKDVLNMTTYTHLITVARSSNTSTHHDRSLSEAQLCFPPTQNGDGTCIAFTYLCAEGMQH